MSKTYSGNPGTPKELMQAVFSGKEVQRIPFAPAIYEHKAFLINETPSEVAKDRDLFSNAVLTEYSTYRPDLLTIGLDVYNIEPEALGCNVKYYPNSNDVPVIEGPIVGPDKDLSAINIPDPHSDGRMPLMLEVGKRVEEELGEEVLIRGAISGPFTLACNLGGQQKIIMEAYKRTPFIHNLLEVATKTIKKYANAWIDNGLDVIMFDSLASPPLVSPDMYTTVIKPYHLEIFNFLKNFELSHRPLIIGGDTTNIATDLAEVGANLLLSDYNADLGTYLKIAEEREIALRANLDPNLIRTKTTKKLEKLAMEVVAKGEILNRFILGTGVLVYDTPTENVLAIKKVSEKYNRKKLKDSE